MNALLSCRIDTSNLNRAQAIFNEYGKTVPAQSIARTALFVIDDAQRNTPVTSVGRIDSELSIITTPVLSSRGKRKGLPLKSGKKNYTVVEGGLGTRIALARLSPYSDYNILTDRRYALDRATFSPGGGQAGFWARIEEVVKHMIAARHSSTHFFKQSWNAIREKLLPWVPPAYRRGRITDSDANRAVNPLLGNASMSANGFEAVLTIENLIGLDDRFPTISAIRNLGAHQILAPVLQASIDREFASKMEYAAKQGWIDRMNQLKALGVEVSS